jgi:hypothetical protein
MGNGMGNGTGNGRNQKKTLTHFEDF